MIRGPVALVSCREAIGLDTDMPLIVASLEIAGVESEIVSWDADIDWSQYSLVVIRSTWDYHRRYAAFMTWVHDVARRTRLANSAEIVAWNTDKRYLSELATENVPIVPTIFVSPTEVVTPGEVRGVLEHGDVVVKPSISAGSNDTERHADVGAVIRHVEAIHSSGRTAMVQPYLRTVETDSETGLVYIDGVYSHAFAKGPMLRDPKTMAEGLYAEERIDARRASPIETDLGERVLDLVTHRFGTPLYTRVDLLPSPDGPVVIEVEMTEPSLYVHLGVGEAEHASAADRLAAAIARYSA